MDPGTIASAVAGVVKLAIQVASVVAEWKNVPAHTKTFIDELETLKSVLQETTTNILWNPQFAEAFEGRRSVLAAHLGTSLLPTADPPAADAPVSMLRTCEKELDDTLDNLRKRAKGHRFGWERGRGALFAQSTRDSVAALRQRCQVLNQMILVDNTVLQLKTFEVVKTTSVEVNTMRTEQEQQRQKEMKENLEKNRSVVLDWLTAVDYASQHRDLVSRRQQGTGQWLLVSTGFQDWLAVKGKTLFCPGIPGAGKTILTSIVVDELATRFQYDHSTIGIAYIYCNFRQKNTQKAQALLESLLKQLSQRRADLPESVKTLYDRHQSRETRPSFGEVSEALHSVSSLYSRVFIVVDALDEADEHCRARFLPEMFTLQRKYQANIFATSRFIPGIMKKFESASSTSLEIRASKEDIEMYLENQISQSSPLEDWPHLHDETKAGISDAVDGMSVAAVPLLMTGLARLADLNLPDPRFLLAQIYLGFVEDKTSPKAIRSAIIQFRRSTPGSSEEQRRQVLDEAYEHVMERINEQGQNHRRLAIRVLSWITCAMTPLATVELQHALAVEVGATELDKENFPSIEKMVSACAGLVIVDQERNVIRLVHYTTQEYFEQTQERWFPDAETDITRTCVTYLSFEAVDDRYRNREDLWKETCRLKSIPFYQYAACHWGYHARKASTFCHEIIDFVTCQAKVQAASLVMQHHLAPYGGPSVTGLHLIAFFGFQEAFDHLAHHFQSLDVTDQGGETPLMWAIRQGHYGTVKLLLDQGADINWKNKHKTPLSCAAETRHEDITKLLLDRGADISGKGVDNWAPVLIAVSCGHEGTVKLLLDRGADVNTGDENGMTPLSAAAWNGSEGIVKLLLDRGANVNPEVGKEQPLIEAIRNGHEGIAKLLLDHGANLEARTRGSTPLFHAVYAHSAGSVRLLLDKGANIEAKDHMGRTPLSSASSESDNGKVIKLLLERGANIEAKDSEGRTPLSHAAETSTGDEAFKLLLRGGTNIETEDKNGMTPLIYAAGKPLIYTAGKPLRYAAGQLMSLSDFRMRLSQRSYPRPLFPSSVPPIEGRVKLLLEEGADIEKKDENGRTALSHAVSHCFGKGTVRLLLERGANIHSEDKDGRTPLSYAASEGGRNICKLLLRGGANIETRDKNGRTPLSYAAQSGRGPTVTVLLEKGADINTPDNESKTPFWYAVAATSARVQHEEDGFMKYNDREYADLTRLERERFDVIEVLLDCQTLLAYTFEQGCNKTVVRLLQSRLPYVIFSSVLGWFTDIA